MKSVGCKDYLCSCCSISNKTQTKLHFTFGTAVVATCLAPREIRSLRLKVMKVSYRVKCKGQCKHWLGWHPYVREYSVSDYAVAKLILED